MLGDTNGQGENKEAWVGLKEYREPWAQDTERKVSGEGYGSAWAAEGGTERGSWGCSSKVKGLPEFF